MSLSHIGTKTYTKKAPLLNNKFNNDALYFYVLIPLLQEDPRCGTHPEHRLNHQGIEHFCHFTALSPSRAMVLSGTMVILLTMVSILASAKAASTVS